MLESLKSLLKRTALSKCEAPFAQNRMDDLRVATCALLLEAAHADQEFTEEERAHIQEAVKGHFGLSQEAADELIRSSENERRKSIDLWHFTRIVKDTCSKEEKLGILDLVWQVVYSDSFLSGHEDYLMHKLATLLGLSHRQLIEAKLKTKKTRNL
ncbi:MAG: TerB family tellurite resistance protein [Pseudomonadota bacterium]